MPVKNLLDVSGTEPAYDSAFFLNPAFFDRNVQFTELSGRCSVFERPLSDAKRPLFF